MDGDTTEDLCFGDECSSGMNSKLLCCVRTCVCVCVYSNVSAMRCSDNIP
jgi:hypothetical protein